MLFIEKILILEAYTFLSELKGQYKLYVFLFLVMALLYFIVLHIIRFVIALELTQTLSYVISILMLIVGMSVYIIVSEDVQVKPMFRMVFESVAVFGVLLFALMVFRSLIRKIKT